MCSATQHPKGLCDQPFGQSVRSDDRSCPEWDRTAQGKEQCCRLRQQLGVT